jgi:MarR family
MAKHGKERQDRYFQLHHFMMKTDAWKALTAPARAVYVAIGYRYNGANNGRISLSVREAASECNVARGTASAALKQLVELGFIEETRHGGLSRKTKVASEWRLTVFKCDLTGALKTCLFMQRGALARDLSQLRSRPQTGGQKPSACINRRSRVYQTTAQSVPNDGTVEGPTVSNDGTLRPISGGSPVPNDGTLIIYHPIPASDATSADDQTLAARSGLALPPADDAPVSDGQPPLPSQTPRPRVTRRRRASTSGRRMAK